MGGAKDVDRAVAAARRAFDGYSRTTPAERLALLERVLAAYKAHYDEIAQAISTEMGAPITLAKGSQTAHRRRAHQRHDRGAEDLQVRGDARHHAAGAGAGGRMRADHAVELAHEPGGRQSRPGAGGRLHHGPQALRVFAVQRHSMGQGHARGRCPRRRVQPDQRRRPERRRAAVLASAKSTWCRSPARRAPAPRSREMRRRRSSGCIRSSAANRRTCCWTMPTSSAP